MSTVDYVCGLRRVIGTRPVNWVGAAGISELGEALPDTPRREGLEETGLRIGVVELLGMLSPAGLTQVAKGDQFYSSTALFHVTEWNGNPVPDGVEIAEARFCSLAGLPPLTRLGRKALEWLA